MAGSAQRRFFLVLVAAALTALGWSLAAEAEEPRAAEGKALAFDRGKGNCLSCHAIPGGELAGTIGPSLEGLRTRYSKRDDVVAIIQDETKRNPQTVMPPFGRNLILTDREIRLIVDYLYTL